MLLKGGESTNIANHIGIVGSSRMMEGENNLKTKGSTIGGGSIELHVPRSGGLKTEASQIDTARWQARRESCLMLVALRDDNLKGCKWQKVRKFFR
jgi:hypothetical protein